jgi:hypothetical protein
MIPEEGKGGSGILRGEKDGYDVAEGMSVEKEADLYPFFEGIWKKIDQAVSYPDALARQRIQGKVSIEFSVRKDGTFAGKFFRAEADDLILKTYVMAILVHALSEPLTEHRWSDRNEMILVAEFQFKVEILGMGADVARQKESRHFKNRLTFYRTSFAEPIMKEKIEEVLSRSIPPFIPVPGGFYIDFYRAYQMVKNQRTLTESEMRDTRVNQLKEQWEGLIQRSRPEG